MMAIDGGNDSSRHLYVGVFFNTRPTVHLRALSRVSKWADRTRVFGDGRRSVQLTLSRWWKYQFRDMMDIDLGGSLYTRLADDDYDEDEEIPILNDEWGVD